jgi:hypothetical protein
MGNPLKMKAKISQNLRPNNNAKDKSKKIKKLFIK